MRKRAIFLLIAFLLLLLAVRMTETPASAKTLGKARQVAAQSIPDTEGLETKAKAAVVLDARTGRVLFAKNANGRMPMASTTKIMSALLALEQENLEAYFTVDSVAIRVEGSSMGLREGDSASLLALAYGMMLPSGNDAANAAAVRIAGSKQAFAGLMNARAAELGMEDTQFVTPSGLDDPAHFSSAYDMALLTREALQNPLFADICSRPKAVVQYGSPPYNRWLTNHNRLLRSYEGVVGVKTGFTDAAGRCLVSAASRGGIKLIVVTLACPDDWNEHKKLYDHYFGALTLTDFSDRIPEVSVPVAGGVSPAVGITFDPPEPVALLPGETLEVAFTARPFQYAPVSAGQVLGEVRVTCDGEPVAELPLTASREIPAVPGSKRPFFLRLFGGGSA